MSERRQFLMQGTPAEVTAQIARFLADCGMRSAEFGYEPDRDDDDYEPAPGEIVSWYAEATYPDGETVRAEHRSASRDQRGLAIAAANLLSKLGANIGVLDLTERT